MFVFAINGSPNQDGNTAYLLQSILDQLDGMHCEMVHIATVMQNLDRPFCTACSTPCTKACFKGTELETVFEKMRKADVILCGSPVYFGAPTAQLEAFFDKSRSYRGEHAFVGKYGAAIACGASKYGGQEATVRTIQNNLLVHGMTILGPGSHQYDAGHLGVCAQRPACEDDFAKSRCLSLAARIRSLQ